MITYYIDRATVFFADNPPNNNLITVTKIEFNSSRVCDETEIDEVLQTIGQAAHDMENMAGTFNEWDPPINIKVRAFGNIEHRFTVTK